MQDTVWDFALAKLTCVFSIVSVSMHSEEVEIPLEFRLDMQPGIRLTLICALSSAPATAAVRMSSACATPTLL